jgi:hypothetical protein
MIGRPAAAWNAGRGAATPNSADIVIPSGPRTNCAHSSITSVGSGCSPWLLVVTTGLRRGQLVGLRRRDVDLDVGTVSPSEARVVVDGHATESDPKTDNAARPLSRGAASCRPV